MVAGPVPIQEPTFGHEIATMVVSPEAKTQAPEAIQPNAVQRNYCSSIEGGLNDCAGACSLLCKAILAVKDGLVNFGKSLIL